MAYPKKSATIRRAMNGIGFGEEPAGSNKTKFNHWFYGHMVAAPWCAIFVCWILIGAGFKVKKNAGADELAAQLLRMHGWKRISASHIDSGDVVKFKNSHIGFCKARMSNGKKRTIEGNYGIKVRTVERSTSSIDYGIRPPYSPERVAKPKPEELPPHPPEAQHTIYIVHGNVNNDPGKLTDYNGWTELYPSPSIGSFVYPNPDLGSEFTTCNGDLYIPIKWNNGANTGWYRKDYLQWAN